ncbi:MAG: ribosome-associated translation inhibitor RaiA [Gammaproteobacteria bacterium]|jgi:putative sigma-54 modulation protein|nr:ribosome-associated translation inhibitor RaiA [Pseudomonadota bacterium]QOJ21382.1 MAG: ribosome-associated translation inhibitor RaiA [Gammaproteobacteria bacterium]
MNLKLTGNHVEITDAMRDYVTSKISKITRHFDHVIDVSVILSVEKLKQKAEANVHIRGKDIFVETDSEDMYASIDSLVDKLDRQILKHKEKNLERRNHGSLKDQDLEQ